MAENRIQQLIDLDNGECMIFLNNTIQCIKSHLPTATGHSHATTFSKSVILIIFIVFFVCFFRDIFRM
jgi:hypothetical protein